MAQIDNLPRTKTSPLRMQHLIRGGAEILELQNFLGHSCQLYKTTVLWKKSHIFFTIQPRPFIFLVDAANQCFYAMDKKCILPIICPL